jgi:serine/threonine protein kinase
MCDLIEKMLEYDPEKRITVADSLKHEFFDSLSENQRLPCESSPIMNT